MRLALFLALLAGACAAPPPATSDATLEMRWSTGSLPPPYHYAEITRLQPAGGELTVALSYGDGPDTTLTFAVGDAERAALQADLAELGLWSTGWREDTDPPVGGSSWWLDARAGDRTAEVPSFVVGGQSRAADAIYDRVRSVVPLDARAAAEAWRRAEQSRMSE